MNVSDIKTILREGVETALLPEFQQKVRAIIDSTKAKESYTHNLNEREHTGCYLLSFLCLLEEHYWEEGLNHYFNINGVTYLLHVSYQSYLSG